MSTTAVAAPAATASAKPFNMLGALAEGFKSVVDAKKRAVIADTCGFTTSKPVKIQNVALTALSEHTGSSWVMPQVNGIPFTCTKMFDWSEKFTEQPPILRLKQARMELVAVDPDNQGYRIRIVDGRTQPEPLIDHYYFRDDPDERHSNPCFELSYFPSWKTPRTIEDAAVTKSVQRIKAYMAINKAIRCDRSSHFKGFALPWIQYNSRKELVKAHVVIDRREFLLVNHLDLDSVQKYALTLLSSIVSKKQTQSLDYQVIGSYETIGIGYWHGHSPSSEKGIIKPQIGDQSLVEQYEKAVVPPAAAPTAAATATTMTVGMLNNKEN